MVFRYRLAQERGMLRRRPTRGWRGGARTPNAPIRRAFRDLESGSCGSSSGPRSGDRKGRRLGVPAVQEARQVPGFVPVRLRRLCAAAGTTVTLPRRGTIKTHESTRKLARRISMRARPASCRLPSRAPPSAGTSRSPARLSVPIPNQHARLRVGHRDRSGRAGTLLTGVDNEGDMLVMVPGPKPAPRSGLRPLAPGQPRAHSRKKPGSANRRKTAARLALPPRPRGQFPRGRAAHGHHRSQQWRYEAVIVAEDLNVAGMTRNRRLARAISDQGFGTKFFFFF